MMPIKFPLLQDLSTLRLFSNADPPNPGLSTLTAVPRTFQLKFSKPSSLRLYIPSSLSTARNGQIGLIGPLSLLQVVTPWASWSGICLAGSKGLLKTWRKIQWWQF